MTNFDPNMNIDSSIPPLRKTQSVVDQETHEKRLSRRLRIHFDYYLFTTLFLLILASAVFFDNLPLYILAVLFAPLQSPIITFCFNITKRKYERWVYIFVAWLFNLVGVFGIGALIGLVVQQFPQKTLQLWRYFTDFTWAHILLLIIGTGLLFFIIHRNPNQNILVANIAVVYSLFLPVLAAGVALSIGDLPIFYQSLINFAILQMICLFLGVLIVKLNSPDVSMKKSGFILTGIFMVTLALGYIKYMPSVPGLSNQSEEPPIAFGQFTSTPTLAQPTQEEIQLPTIIKTDFLQPTVQVVVKSATATLPPTITPTVTLTPMPTPVWAQIRAQDGEGANIRANPDFTARIVRTVLNGTMVEILPETVEVDGNTWVHVRLEDQTEGWIIRNLILASTPAAEW